MTEMKGSIPVFSFVLSPSPAEGHVVVARRLTAKLQKAGWVWYKDFKYDEFAEKGVLFEVYNEKLVPIIKELVVEYNI
jgi:hypothetical protein